MPRPRFDYLCVMNKIFKIIAAVAVLLFALTSCNNSALTGNKRAQEWAIVLHGGAGGSKDAPKMSPEREKVYTDALSEGIAIGQKMLEEGRDAVDVVQAVVVYMENNPLFNAGKGACLNSDCIHELDAAIMDGRDLNAGAVAGLKDVKNPILAARQVMDNSPHVFLIGEGASSFARDCGLEMVENSYFDTEKTATECEKIRKKYQGQPMGTVGCVALDKKGNLAAATSTGGMSGKKWGRVGDVPVIGAGTYADNESVAVSGTGHGELWIRRCVGFDISALVKYKGLSLKDAASDVIWNKINTMDGSGGGVICVDKKGNICMEFNTALMFRAYANSSGERGAAVYKE